MENHNSGEEMLPQELIKKNPQQNSEVSSMFQSKQGEKKAKKVLGSPPLPSKQALTCFGVDIGRA